MEDEGVGSATEIGDVDPVKVRMVAQDIGGSQNLLSETPVMMSGFFRIHGGIQGKEVHGNGQDSQFP